MNRFHNDKIKLYTFFFLFVWNNKDFLFENNSNIRKYIYLKVSNTIICISY